MSTLETLRNLALSFPETSEEPHFEKTSFRVRGKIFATFDGINNRTCVKLSELDQDVFSLSYRTVVYPVDNKWGKRGWTMIEMEKVSAEFFTEVLTTAYCEVAPSKYRKLLRPSSTDEI